MLDGRWSDPWTAPVGAAPEREPGEAPYAVLAALHVGMLLVLSALMALLVPAAQDASLLAAGGAAAVAGVAAAAGAAALRRDTALLRWVADFSFASCALGAGLAAAAVALVAGASGAGGLLAGALVAAPVAGLLYVRVRRLWLQAATVTAVALALLATTALADGLPDVVDGLYLLVLGGFVAAGAAAGVLRPLGSGYVLGAVVALAGAQVVLTGQAGPGYLVPLVVLAAVAALVAHTRSASLLPVALLGGLVLLPQVLGPVLGGGRAFGLSLVGVGAAVAWLAVDVERRSPGRTQTGGVWLACSLLALPAAWVLTSQGDLLAALLACVGLVVFFAAAAAARRRPATVLSGLLAVMTVPGVLARPFADQWVAGVLLQLALAAAAVLVAVRLDRRAPRPAAARPADFLSAPGAEATLDAPYPLVFDTAVRLLGSAGLVLQLVDRAGGRILAGPVEAPVLGAGLWSTGPVTTRLRAVGTQADVERFLADLQAQVGNRVAAPH